MAGAGEEEETTDTETEDTEETPAESDGEHTPDSSDENEDDSNEEEQDESTPAGKKFAQLRREKKEAEEQARLDREARIKAEAERDGYEKAMKEAGMRGEKREEPVEEDVGDIHPDDEKAVLRVLKKQGVDINALKAAGALPELTQRIQKQEATQKIQNACTALEKKYANSVPFNAAEVVKYAAEQGFALDMQGASFERILERAHKEMNEQKFQDWAYAQRSKKKDSPKIENNGTGKKAPREEEAPKNPRDFRAKAFELAGVNPKDAS